MFKWSISIWAKNNHSFDKLARVFQNTNYFVELGQTEKHSEAEVAYTVWIEVTIHWNICVQIEFLI